MTPASPGFPAAPAGSCDTAVTRFGRFNWYTGLMHHLTRVLFLTAALAGPAWASGDFVILARGLHPDGPKTVAAAVWRLDEQASQIVPVAHLEKSHWSPTQLHPARPDLLRLQVPDSAAPRGYRVVLYHISYDDWTVREVSRGDKAFPAFEHAGAVYLETTEAGDGPLVRLRFPPGSAEPEALAEPFEHVCPVTISDRHHIIRRDGVQYLYDAATGASRLVGHSNPIEGDEARPVLSPDGSHLAYFVEVEVLENAEQPYTLYMALPVFGRIVVLDLEQDKRHTFVAWVYRYFGSGVNPLIGPDLTFDDQGRLHYRAIPTDRIPRGKSAKPVALQETSELSDFRFDPRTKSVEPVPPGETVERTQRRADDWHDTAWAYLHAQGIENPRPVAWMNTTVGFDADRVRFLLKCVGVGLDGTFFLADTAAGTLARIPSPPGLTWSCDMRIIHIPPSDP